MVPALVLLLQLSTELLLLRALGSLLGFGHSPKPLTSTAALDEPWSKLLIRGSCSDSTKGLLAFEGGVLTMAHMVLNRA